MALTEKLTNIADAIRLKRDIVDELTLEDMALQVSLIDGGGGGGGNLQKTKVLDTVIRADQHAYLLDKSFADEELLQVQCVLTLPTAINGNKTVYSGFGDSATPIAQYEQMFQIGYRANQTINIHEIIPPKITPTTVGYWFLYGENTYAPTFGVGYGRAFKPISTYFTFQAAADISEFDGAHFEVYTIHKL